MLFVLGHLLLFLALGWTVFGLGAALLRLLKVGEGDEFCVVSGVLGLGGVTLGVFLLGLFGGLRAPVLLGFWGGCVGAGWWVWRDSRTSETSDLGLCRLGAKRLGALPQTPPGNCVPWTPVSGASRCFLALRAFFSLRGCLWGLAVLPLLLLALYPPTAFDETTYQLPMSRTFARTGSLPFVSELRYPAIPILQQATAAALMLGFSDVSTHLLQLLATLLNAGLLFVWGNRLSGPLAGSLAAAVWLGCPLVVHLATSGYVEAELALFVTAALYALDRWQETRRSGWLALAGGFAGLAAGFKVLGLFFVVSIGLEALLTSARTHRIRAGLLFAAAALLVLAPVYGRIVHWTGNPVFPFCPWLFGPNDYQFTKLPGDNLLERMGTLLRLPYSILLDRAAVGSHPPISPAALPGALLLATFPLGRRLLLHAVVYCLLVPTDTRYFAAVLPLACLGLGRTLAAGDRLTRKHMAAALCLTLFLPGWLYAGYRILRQGPLPTTAQQRQEYLEERFPLFPALHQLNQTLGPGGTIYLCHAENQRYLFEGTTWGEWNGPGSFDRVLSALQEPTRLHRILRDLGVEALVLRREAMCLTPETPEFHALFRLQYSDPNALVYALR